MKYRRNKVKREHGIIQNGLPWLESLGLLPEVTDIIPGVIDVSRSSERGIVYKYATQTGCKLLLKSNGSIQEAFVVTKNPACVQEWVEKEFPPDPPTTSQVSSPSDLQEGLKKNLCNTHIIPSLGSNNKQSSRRRCSKKHAYRKVSKSFSGKVDVSTVADCLDISTLKALNHLKEALEVEKIKNITMENFYSKNDKMKHRKFREK